MTYYRNRPDYDEPLFRPPSEAQSLIFQVTLGCSWNRCTFCEMYKSKSFTVRKEEDVFSEIEEMSRYYPDERKIFLADGNAMVLSNTRLIRILEKIKQCFPKVGRISSYALPADIRAKSPVELTELMQAGLQLIYVGIESGDDEVLQMIEKGETAASTIEGLLKARDAGIQSSVMIINGLAGVNFCEQHAIHSAEVINKIQPRYLSTLVLMTPYGVEKYSRGFKGRYTPMNDAQLIDELELFVRHLELERTVFRSDHASNFVVLKGTLSKDKEHLLNTIKSCRGVATRFVNPFPWY